MKRQQRTPGSIVEIKIENQYFVYGQLLKSPYIVFFDFKSETQLKNIEELFSKNSLFILAVYHDVVSRGHWLKVGKLKINEIYNVLPDQFISTFPGDYRIYDPNTGTIRKATKEECLGLERCAVWEKIGVEQRISDFYNGVPNIWEKEDAL